MEYVVTIALKHTGDDADAARLLDAFVAEHADASPVVGEDPKTQTLDVSFSVEADDGYQAFGRAHATFTEATANTDFANRTKVGINVELVESSNLATV
jgi:hypothetical protein